MNAIKTLLAVSVLAAAGAANAATIATYNVSLTGVFSGAATGSLNETGTASLDDSGVLTVLTGGTTSTTPGGTFYKTTTWVFNGPISGGTLNNTSGTMTNTSCSGTCSASLKLNQAQPLSATGSAYVGGQRGGLFEQAFVISGGTNTAYVDSLNGYVHTAYTWNFTDTTPAVPVPAAAWLFGSGLLGLAGAARRRRAA